MLVESLEGRQARIASLQAALHKATDHRPKMDARSLSS
jgi:hypothetical protein